MNTQQIFGKASLSALNYLSLQKLRVFTVLSSFQGNSKTCHPSLAAIRERLAYYKNVNGKPVKLYHYSLGYISKIIKSLREDGWVILVKQGGHGVNNVYQVVECPERLLFPIETEYSFPEPDKVENKCFPPYEGEQSFPAKEGKVYKRTLKEQIKEHGKPILIDDIKQKPADDLSWHNWPCWNEDLVTA